MTNRYLLTLSALLSITCLFAQTDKDKWDVNNPPGELREVTFSTTEGTWMNLDVSPDGQTIVFDLLGDIYTIPMTGGNATVLRQGLAYEVQPRFSPDGQHILFTSDAGGGDNIWIMDPDGQNARQVTEENFRLLNNPAWSPDGNYFVARKHFTSSRSAGAGEMWMYHLSGGSGIQLTERKNDQQDVNEPAFSPDGKYLYFSEDMYPGGYFQYNKDPNSQIYVIRRYDMEKGEIRNMITGPGGAIRPQPSHDGKWLAFVRRIREQSVLFKYNIETGEQYPIFNKLSKDQQEAWALFGAYTGFSWTPDDQYIIVWGQGKIWKVNAETGDHTEIPFSVEATHQFNEIVAFENPVFEETFTAKAIRHAVTSPDEKWLVFNAAGYLWKKALPDGTPERLTQSSDLEFEPSFSRDGSKLVYVSWDDQEMGAIQIMDWASGRTQAITDQKAIYRSPSFSPDASEVVYQKAGGNYHQGYAHCQEPGLYRIPSAGGEATFITPQGSYPVYNADGSRIFFQTGGYLFGSLTKSYHSIKPDGTDNKKHFDGKHAQRFVPSPDGQWIAWSELYKVYIAPMPLTGKPVGISANTKAVPVAQVARDAGINLHWSNDSERLHWTLGEEYYTEELTDRFLFLEGAQDSVPPIDTVGLRIGLELPSDAPEGLVAFTNARIITMEGMEVIEQGDILIDGNTIKKIGPTGSFRIPGSAKVYDATGKTIMPGIIDVHGHLGNFRYGLSPQQQWEYHANLAYGVTTAHDPSSNSEMIFSQSEMIRAGNMVGPRLYSTGTILYGAEGDFKAVINSLEDARSAIRRTAAYGAFSVKSYNQPRREQRQQVIQAAKELGILVVPEGGSHFLHNMTMIADGHTGVEHNIPVAPLYNDVIQFWSSTQTHNTPTLIVNYGGINGEYYWYQNTNVWEKDRLLNFTPRPVVDSRARHRTMIPEEEYENGHILVSASCNALQQAGVNINLGAHGQLQGLGAHWELWMFVQGGMSNHQALRAATINGAEYLGMEQEIGSLKEGKLADLIVIDGNPLVDIFNSENVEFTMVNGRLYDSATMNEVGHYDKPCAPFYFQLEGSGNAFPYYLQTGSHMAPSCSCQQ